MRQRKKNDYAAIPSHMSKWFKRFENGLETLSQTAASKLRCFISWELPGLSTIGIIPESMLGRRKLRAIGWSTKFNFNEDGLQISVDVLNNFPLEDLRYFMEKLNMEGILQITGIE